MKAVAWLNGVNDDLRRDDPRPNNRQGTHAVTRKIQPPTMHTKLVAASVSDMVQEWYQGKCEVPPMQVDTFEQRISRFQSDLTPPAADYVAGSAQNDTVESFCATLRSLIADAHAERDRFANIAATIRINALHQGATNAEVDAMLSGEISFVNWIADKVEALAARPASPDTRVPSARSSGGQDRG